MEDKKKTEKIKDDNLNLSFDKISKNLNLGQLKKNTFRAFASRAKNGNFKTRDFSPLIKRGLNGVNVFHIKM